MGKLLKDKSLPVVILCGLLLFFALIAACILILTAKKENYDEIRGEIEKILNTKDEIVGIFDVADKDGIAGTIKKFNEQYVNLESSMDAIEKSSISKDSRLEEVINSARSGFEKIELSHQVVDFYERISDGEISSEDLNVFSESKNEFVKDFAVDYRAYASNVETFSGKYQGEFESKNEDFERESEDLLKRGSDMIEKYNNTKIDDILGFKKESIGDFYVAIDDLGKCIDLLDGRDYLKEF